MRNDNQPGNLTARFSSHIAGLKTRSPAMTDIIRAMATLSNLSSSCIATKVPARDPITAGSAVGRISRNQAFPAG